MHDLQTVTCNAFLHEGVGIAAPDEYRHCT